MDLTHFKHLQKEFQRLQFMEETIAELAKCGATGTFFNYVLYPVADRHQSPSDPDNCYYALAGLSEAEFLALMKDMAERLVKKASVLRVNIADELARYQRIGGGQ